MEQEIVQVDIIEEVFRGNQWRALLNILGTEVAVQAVPFLELFVGILDHELVNLV
jgi:hypothetical protein